jgi:tetratricopeptide (TPR) repeat protein
MLRAAAYHRAELPDEAERAFFEARVYLWSTRNAELQAELEYYEAVFAWSSRDLDAASQHARAALDEASLSVHARALELLGAIAASSGNYLGQADYLERALTHIESFSERDVWVEAHILYNLSILVRELHLDSIVDRLGKRVESLPWTDETAVPRFEALRHVAWCYALSGNHVKAFRLLRESAEIAPTIPWRILAFLDRSMLAREMGEVLFAEDEMQGAETIAEGFDWNASSGDERLALLQLAELTAERAPERARRYIERYRAIKRRMSALHAFRADRRLRALECYAEAAVARAHDQYDRAILLLNEAFHIWSSIGYAWRGVVSSLLLYELTEEPHFRECASHNIQRFSASWITRRFESVFPS